MKTYYKIVLSAHSEKNAREIITGLAERRLISQGLIFPGDSVYWWNGKIDEDRYFHMHAFTEGRHLDGLQVAVRELSDEDVPAILFFKIDHVNEEFVEWVEKSIK